MAELKVYSKPEVNAVFAKYPAGISEKMQHLRKLVIRVAEESDLESLEECLKWGEPSYISKKGSTIRMDWKPKYPNQYALYFQCSSRLVATFKLVFGDLFKYEGNRALVFSLDENLPELELKHCINTALFYHQRKDLLTLGL